MFNWRITKYNPNYRDEVGRYKKSEWTSFSEIGTTFNGKKLTTDDYSVIENAYVDIIVALMNELGIESLQVRDLEKMNNKFMPNKIDKFYSDEMVNFYISLQENDVLNIKEIQYLSRLVLRENLWCKLEKDHNMFVHFGYDYYMYIGSHKNCKNLINTIMGRGLFIEDFVSPYNDEEDS